LVEPSLFGNWIWEKPTMTKRGSQLSAFRNILESFRHSEKAEAVLLVAQDAQLVRLLLAWERTPVRRKRRLSKMPGSGSDRSRWEWLWENVSYSVDDLAKLSGLSVDQVEKQMAVLRGNGLAHPDGTVNRYAAQYLKTKVLALFKAKSMGQACSKKLAQDASS
jgi:hypothetical protein